MDPDLTGVQEFYQLAFEEYEKTRTIPPISVAYYPYIGINHTIRVRDGRVYVRIAEVCRDMPPQAHHALAFILVSKLYRRRPPKAAREVYGDYIKSDELRERSTDRKRARGRKVLSGTQGEFYDLDEIFDDLNNKYFDRRLTKPVLSWSARRTYRILGHHDATHETIIVSRSLDSIDTPRYVLEAVLYHEMLHVHHPTVHHNGRRYNHTPAFRRDEEKFEHFDKAERWIENNVRKLKRTVKRERRKR